MPKKIHKIESLNTGMSGNTDPQEAGNPLKTINVDIREGAGTIKPTNDYTASGVQSGLIPYSKEIFTVIDPSGERHRVYLDKGNILYIDSIGNSITGVTDCNLYGNILFFIKEGLGHYLYFDDDSKHHYHRIQYNGKYMLRLFDYAVTKIKTVNGVTTIEILGGQYEEDLLTSIKFASNYTLTGIIQEKRSELMSLYGLSIYSNSLYIFYSKPNYISNNKEFFINIFGLSASDDIFDKIPANIYSGEKIVTFENFPSINAKPESFLVRNTDNGVSISVSAFVGFNEVGSNLQNTYYKSNIANGIPSPFSKIDEIWEGTDVSCSRLLGNGIYKDIEKDIFYVSNISNAQRTFNNSYSSPSEILLDEKNYFYGKIRIRVGGSEYKSMDLFRFYYKGKDHTVNHVSTNYLHDWSPSLTSIINKDGNKLYVLAGKHFTYDEDITNGGGGDLGNTRKVKYIEDTRLVGVNKVPFTSYTNTNYTISNSILKGLSGSDTWRIVFDTTNDKTYIDIPYINSNIYFPSNNAIMYPYKPDTLSSYFSNQERGKSAYKYYLLETKNYTDGPKDKRRHTRALSFFFPGLPYGFGILNDSREINLKDCEKQFDEIEYCFGGTEFKKLNYIKGNDEINTDTFGTSLLNLYTDDLLNKTYSDIVYEENGEIWKILEGFNTYNDEEYNIGKFITENIDFEMPPNLPSITSAYRWNLIDEIDNRLTEIVDDIKEKNLYGKCHIYGSSFIPNGEYRILYDSVKKELNIDGIEVDGKYYLRFELWRKNGVPIFTDTNSFYAYDHFHIQNIPEQFPDEMKGEYNKDIDHSVLYSNIVDTKQNRVALYHSHNPYNVEINKDIISGNPVGVTAENYNNDIISISGKKTASGNIVPYGQYLQFYPTTTSQVNNLDINYMDLTGKVISKIDLTSESIVQNPSDIKSIYIKPVNNNYEVTYLRKNDERNEGPDGTDITVFRNYTPYPRVVDTAPFFHYVKDIAFNSITHANPTELNQLLPDIYNSSGVDYFIALNELNGFSVFPYSYDWNTRQTDFIFKSFYIDLISASSGNSSGFSADFNYRYSFCYEFENDNFSHLYEWTTETLVPANNNRSITVQGSYLALKNNGIRNIKIFYSYTPKDSNLWSLPEELHTFSVMDFSTVNNTISYVPQTFIPILHPSISYEGLTGGVSSTLPYFLDKYTHHIIHNNYSFISGAKDIQDMFLLFRSKKDMLATFDWSNDYIKIPELVIGMAALHGKILLFSEGNIYVVEAETMEILQVAKNIEIIDNKSWLIIEDKWMVLSCKSGAYVFDGTEFTRITEAIEKSWSEDGPKWKQYNKVGLISVSQKVYFWGEKIDRTGAEVGGKILALVWHYPSKKWGYEEIPSGTTMIYNDIYDDITVSNSNVGDMQYFFVTNDFKVVEFNSNTVTYTYKTNLMDLGIPEEKKVYYGVRIRIKKGAASTEYREFKEINPKYFYNLIFTIISDIEIMSIEILWRPISRGGRFTADTEEDNLKGGTLEKSIDARIFINNPLEQ